MDFKEAIDSIGTTSPDVKGVRKRFGITRRKVPAGFTATDYYPDEEEDEKKKKKKKKKKKNEGRRITRDDRPMETGDWHRDFFKKGDNADIEDDDENEDDEKKLKELLMQVSGPEDSLRMDAFWVGSKKYDGTTRKRVKKKDDDESEEDYKKRKEKEEEDDEVEEMRGITNFVDPHYDKKAIDPFWKKGNRKKHYYDDYEDAEDERSEEEEEDEDDAEEDKD